MMTLEAICMLETSQWEYYSICCNENVFCNTHLKLYHHNFMIKYKYGYVAYPIDHYSHHARYVTTYRYKKKPCPTNPTRYTNKRLYIEVMGNVIILIYWKNSKSLVGKS